MKIVLSDRVLDNMTIFRWSLKEFRVTNQYFHDHMLPHTLDTLEGGSNGIQGITVKLGSGKEIPVIIDDTVENYKVVYNMAPKNHC